MDPSTQKTAANAPRDSGPGVGTAAVPMWLMMLPLVLLFWGALYFDRNGGWFSSSVYSPYTSLKTVQTLQPASGADQFLILGRLKFEATCGICHGSDGAGKLAQAPPFAGSEWVLTENIGQLIRIPLQGLTGPIEVKGETWNLAMVGLSMALSDEELAAVLSYMRTSWGNDAPMITPEDVAAVREATKDRKQQWTATELQSVR